MKGLWKDVVYSGTANNNTTYGSVVDTSRSTGETAFQVVTAAGNIAVSQQYSMDGIHFYDSIDGSDNALGTINASLTVGTYYIVPATVVAPYSRLKVIENGTASTVVKITMIFQEEQGI